MPTKLSTTVNKIRLIPNEENVKLVLKFHEFMKDNGASERHQNNNLKAILSEAGLGFGHVIKTTIFLKDMSLFVPVNEVYGKFFESGFPARETVAVKGLPKDANVEISMIAAA